MAIVKSFMPKAALLAAGLLLLTTTADAQLPSGGAPPTRGLHHRYEKTTGLTNPTSMLVDDLVGDEGAEVVITDSGGNIRMFDAMTGELIRSTRISPSSSLTPAVAGDFLGRNRLDLAIGTVDGRVFLVEGTSLRILAEYSAGTSAITIQPAAVPIWDQATERAGEARFIQQEILVYGDQDGILRALRFSGKASDSDPAKAEKLWEVRVGALSGPPSTGVVTNALTWDIVVGNRNGELFVIDPVDGTALSQRIYEARPIIHSPTIADVAGQGGAAGIDGRGEIIVLNESGTVSCLRYSPEATRPFTIIWEFQSGSLPIHAAVCLYRFPDPSEKFLLVSSPGRLNVLDGRTGTIIFQDQSLLTGKTTQAAFMPDKDFFPEMIVGRGKVLSMTSTLSEIIVRRGAASLTVIDDQQETDFAGPIGLFLHTSGRDTTAQVLALSTKTGRLSRWETNITPYWHSTAVWQTEGQSSWHNSMLNLDYQDRQRQLRDRRSEFLNLQLADLARAQDDGEWATAMEIGDWLRNFNPSNEEFVSARRKVWLRKNLLPLALGVIVSLTLGGFLILRLAIWMSHRNQMKRAAAHAAAGQYEEAREIYASLYARLPESPKVFLPYMQVLGQLGDFSQPVLEVYARAYSAMPDDGGMLHLYTRALLAIPVTDSRAREIYEKALVTYPEPAAVEYGIGMCHMNENDLEEAGKRLRAALRAGFATDAVYANLCNIYLRTQQFTAKTLPVFQHQFSRRNEDQHFLEAFLCSCIDARKTDGEVESLCHQVLEGNPKFIPAYTHLCAIHLQKNAIGQAIDEAKAALDVSPGDNHATALLAHCYLVQQRRDDEALTVYEHALELDPRSKDLLRMVSDLYLGRAKFDAIAADVYRRTLSEIPNELSALKALAQYAHLTNDHPLVIETIEALSAQGQMNARFTRQLATAYLRAGIHNEKSERTLREALRMDAKNPELIQGLAHTLVALERREPEAIPALEAQMELNPGDLESGRLLAECYIATGRFESALHIAQQLLKQKPDDERLKRTMAQASLYGNRIDEAIAEYQRILQRDPHDADAMVNLALAYAQKLRTDDEAMRLYTKACELRPENEQLPLALANVNIARGDQLKAVEWYQKALKSRQGAEAMVIAHAQQTLVEHPDALRVRWFLCEVFVAFNRLREAMEQLLLIFDMNPGQSKNVLAALDKILIKDPTNVQALLQKGRMLIQSGNGKEARKTLELANQLQPGNADTQTALTSACEKILESEDDAETRFTLGKTYYQMQEFDRAIGCFQKTSSDYRWEAESVKALGKCFTAKGMLDLALQEYKKLVVDEETKELLYDLAQRYEAKKDLVGAKTVYRQLFAADIDYKDVRRRFELLSGSTSDPIAFEKTSIVQQMSEDAARRYELLDELGRGAMGIVYRAKDKELEEVVALKILPDNLSNNPEAVRRFKIEARNARKISHPNIVRIHDIGEEMGRKYISMEFVDGSDLKKKVKTQGKLSMSDSFHYGIQIADALAYAHRQGIVHRDIKPANIMLTSSNDVKITDFGIAKLLDQTGEGTMVGAVIGTPLYMSPEQVQGIPVDARADLYSFGIMLYEFVNGRPPFTEGDLAYQHIHKEPPPLPDIPEAMWSIIARCLAKAKEDRWQKGEDIVEALKAARKHVLG